MFNHMTKCAVLVVTLYCLHATSASAEEIAPAYNFSTPAVVTADEDIDGATFRQLTDIEPAAGDASETTLAETGGMVVDGTSNSVMVYAKIPLPAPEKN
jgi:hypothetical protein